eukprot:2146724-Rhodomonas_salina.1
MECIVLALPNKQGGWGMTQHAGTCGPTYNASYASSHRWVATKVPWVLAAPSVLRRLQPPDEHPRAHLMLCQTARPDHCLGGGTGRSASSGSRWHSRAAWPDCNPEEGLSHPPSLTEGYHCSGCAFGPRTKRRFGQSRRQFQGSSGSCSTRR